MTYLGLHALQHRGQESAGIAASDGRRLSLHRGMGQVIDIFHPQQLERLGGTSAIGHVRYSTSGGSSLKNSQPIAVDSTHGSVAIAHNGNLTNADGVRQQLEEQGSLFQSETDTEVIVHLMAQSRQRTLEDRVADALSKVRGAYSLVCLSEKKMLAVRDPRAIRPLCYGTFPDRAGAFVVSSEPSSFDLVGAEYAGDIDPGEMLVIDESGVRHTRPFERQEPKGCVFEYIYFARADSVIDGISVYEARKNLGRALARRDDVQADLVIPVPDSAVPAAVGYAQQARLPFEMGLVRSPYVGRTFIEPEQSIRHFGVRLKHNAVREVLRGKRVVVVDDSIVRGTTSRKIVKMVRAAGATEVHLRVSSPQVAWPCYYGIDTPTRSELIAQSHTVEEINQYLTSDTLGYLPLEETQAAVLGALIGRPTSKNRPTSDDRPTSKNGAADAEASNGHASEPGRRSLPIAPVSTDGKQVDRFCHACFSGDYPVRFEDAPKPRQMRLLDI
jgi:amidophosphoribosyltransferase